MARLRRHWQVGFGQHFISRFVDRSFKIRSEVDREKYLEYVADADQFWDWKWLSFAVMSSHVHDGLIAGRRHPELFYRRVHGRYAACFHRQHGTHGPVFSGRSKNRQVREGELLRMVAYHHRNPVEAGVAASAAESKWSSHRAYLRIDPAPPFLDVEWAFSVLGFDDNPGGRRAFDEFVMDFDFDAYRDHGRNDDGGQWVGCEYVPVFTGARRQCLDELQWTALLSAVCCVVKTEPSVVCHSSSHKATFARKVLAYVSLNELGYSLEDISRRMFCSRPALSNLVRRLDNTQLQVVRRHAGEVVRLLDLGRSGDAGNFVT